MKYEMTYREMLDGKTLVKQHKSYGTGEATLTRLIKADINEVNALAQHFGNVEVRITGDGQPVAQGVIKVNAFAGRSDLELRMLTLS